MQKAVIMAGGFGTRLRPLTMSIPKPMVPVNNIPMMEHIVNLLKHHNIDNILSVLYFLPEVITDHFRNGKDFDVKMQYIKAVADYGTAGAVRNAADHLKERFIVLSGDVLTDIDLSAAVKFHKERKSMATLLLTRVEKPLQYGIVMTDKDGKITRFLEKPSWGQVFSDTINTGIYILEPEVLDLIPFREEFDFSQDLFPLMLEKNMPLYGYIAEGYWKDVGNLNEYQAAQYDCLSNKINLYTPTNSEKKNNKIATSATLKGNVSFGKNVEIGENTVISDCIIGDNVKIGNGSKIISSTIWNDVKIGDFAELYFDVICSKCTLEDRVFLAEDIFMAENCHIGCGAKLNSNIKLWPNKKVEDGSILSTSLVQEDKWQRELFTGTRITGISNIEINPEFGAKLGSAIGLTFGKGSSIIISRAPDEVSNIIQRAISAGLCSVGVNAINMQETPIPQTRLEMLSGRFESGIHVRRSQRFPDYTDIIIFSNDGRDISVSTTKKIERYFFGEDIHRVKYNELGKLSYTEKAHVLYKNRYLQSLDTDLIRSNKFRILIDYSYGMAAAIFPSILGELNVNALSENSYIDIAKFHPDPSSEDWHEENQTGKIMTSLGYELGFSILSGAEKISVIDEHGEWYSQSRLLIILTKLFLETHKDLAPYKIAVSITASKIIEDIAKEYGVEVIRLEDNHSAMVEATIDKNIKFLGGIYGGYIFADFLIASDGMFTIGKILEMLAQTGWSMSQIDNMLPTCYMEKRLVKVPWASKGTVMRKAMQYSTNMKRLLVEGVKLFFEENNSSVLIIPSIDKAHFALVTESDKQDHAIALANEYTEHITEWKQG